MFLLTTLCVMLQIVMATSFTTGQAVGDQYGSIPVQLKTVDPVYKSLSAPVVDTIVREVNDARICWESCVIDDDRSACASIRPPVVPLPNTD